MAVCAGLPGEQATAAAAMSPSVARFHEAFNILIPPVGSWEPVYGDNGPAPPGADDWLLLLAWLRHWFGRLLLPGLPQGGLALWRLRWRLRLGRLGIGLRARHGRSS